ncbi:MAG: 4-hydroxythreonine-4-phosphate dehydrogenase PdxA [Nitrospinota bacterium]
MKDKKPLGVITMGDPAGIGPEIIVKLAAERSLPKIPIVVIGNAGVLEKSASSLSLPLSIKKLDPAAEKSQFSAGDLNVIHVGEEIVDCPQGKPSDVGGMASAQYISLATRLALENRIDFIVTCPISKEALHLAGYNYAGHTEMFADLTSTSDFAMMLTAKELSVVLVTTHVPVKALPSLIKKAAVLRVIRLVHRDFARWKGKAPSIGIAALNPHGGEGGIFGREEVEEIIPAVQEARAEGICISLPLPADTLFSKNKREGFDVIIAMYHDQGLIPLKMLSFGMAVNVTLGLPFVRTSVDHGTAYDIAGKGIADSKSLREALTLAFEMVHRPFPKSS